jgi:hypothetical protein
VTITWWSSAWQIRLNPYTEKPREGRVLASRGLARRVEPFERARKPILMWCECNDELRSAFEIDVRVDRIFPVRATATVEFNGEQVPDGHPHSASRRLPASVGIRDYDQQTGRR